MPPPKQGAGLGDGPSNPCPPTPSIGRNTRHTTRSPTAIADIEAMLNSVMDTASAESFLNAKLLCHRGQSFTLSHCHIPYSRPMSDDVPTPSGHTSGPPELIPPGTLPSLDYRTISMIHILVPSSPRSPDPLIRYPDASSDISRPPDPTYTHIRSSNLKSASISLW
ncbi:hypothetical protein F4604DRAFT_1941343 [Suillus subluteus]|nr:hypothetical protein F4604DRAFT_1941343 [Suillus subluteus]